MAVRRALSVDDLCGYIKGVFEDELILHNLTVYGEVTEFKTAGANSFFTLQGGENRLSCVSFSGIPPLKTGVSVEADGAVRFYQKTGKISFVAREVRLRGEGKRQAEFLILKERLEREGLFRDKKPTPRRIATVAVVTGESGIVIHDFMRVLTYAGVRAYVAVFPARVQGDGAERDIAAAAARVAAWGKADACVFMRGGGSEGDLEAFNTETAARAVKACPIFTVSAVGHESDITLCDLAADARAGTPSIAAGLIAAAVLESENRITRNAVSLSESAAALWQRQYTKYKSLVGSLTAYAFGKIAVGRVKTKYLQKRLAEGADSLLRKKTGILQDSADSVIRAANTVIATAKTKLELLTVKLDGQSPLKMLAKGFARAEKQKRPVIEAKDLTAGDALDLFFHDGKAEVTVQNISLNKNKTE